MKEYKINDENILEKIVIKFKEKTETNKIREYIIKKIKIAIIGVSVYFMIDTILKISRLYGKDIDKYSSILSYVGIVLLMIFIFKEIIDIAKISNRNKKIKLKVMLKKYSEILDNNATAIRKEDKKIIKRLLKTNNLYDIEIMKEIKFHYQNKIVNEEMPTKTIMNNLRTVIISIIISIITSIMFQKDALENLTNSLDICSVLLNLLLGVIVVSMFVCFLNNLEDSRTNDAYSRICDVLEDFIVLEKRRLLNEGKR